MNLIHRDEIQKDVRRDQSSGLIMRFAMFGYHTNYTFGKNLTHLVDPCVKSAVMNYRSVTREPPFQSFTLPLIFPFLEFSHHFFRSYSAKQLR